mgnify:CR=1 FL=1
MQYLAVAEYCIPQHITSLPDINQIEFMANLAGNFRHDGKLIVQGFTRWQQQGDIQIAGRPCLPFGKTTEKIDCPHIRIGLKERFSEHSQLIFR